MKPIKLLFICLFFVGKAFGQVNLIDTLRLDTLGSNCTYGIETLHKFVFSSDYGENEQIYTQTPFKGSALISIDKLTFQKTTLFHLNNFDTSWNINYLYEKNDTIRTVELAQYIDNSCNCKTLKILNNRYDEQLNLLQSKTVDILKSDSFQFTPFFVSINNNNHLCITTSKIEQNKSLSLYWILDITKDTIVKFRQRFTSYQDSFRAERIHSASINDDGDFLFFGLGLNYDTWTSKDIILKLVATNNYNKKLYLVPHSFTDSFTQTNLAYAVKYAIEKDKKFYITSWGFCLQDSSNSTPFVYKKTVPFIKCFAIDSMLVSYRGACAPIDSSPILSGDPFDIQQPTAKQPIKFINDRTFVEIHPSHVVDNPSVQYTPCQAFPSRLEIVYWDTSLSVLQRTWISISQENFYVNGYFQTAQNQLMIYGHLCRYNHPLDSIQLFAFLLDQNSGHLLNIFNANDFQVENMISINPNPFTNQLLINKTFAQEADLLLYDGLGKLVVHQKIKENSSVISTEDLPNGLYFYSFINAKGERLQAGKLMKE